MINNIRKLIQEKLSSISDLDSGEIVGLDLIEEGVYYLGWKVEHQSIKANLDYSNMRQLINFTGYLSTKGGRLSKLDDFTEAIIHKLEELRFICTTNDISTLDTKVRKVLINGVVRYDYLDGLLK